MVARVGSGFCNVEYSTDSTLRTLRSQRCLFRVGVESGDMPLRQDRLQQGKEISVGTYIYGQE